MAITDEPPTARIIPDAVVTRMALDRPQWRAERNDPALRTGTVYDAAGLPVPVHAMDLRDPKDRLIVRADEPVLSVERRHAATALAGRHVYAGDLKQHFGHFLLESLCRAWAFADRPPGARLIFHAGGEGDASQIVTPFMRFFLEAFGVGAEDVLIANRDLRIEELVVPNSQFDMGTRADVGLAAVFDRVRRHHCPPAAERLPRLVYFTRRAVDALALERLRRAALTPRTRRGAYAKTVANEEQVERLFEARGFVVIAPETLPLARQIELAANARVLAGVAGTALHHALFATDPRTRIVSVATRLSPNQVAIEQLKGLRSAHIFCALPYQYEEPLTIDLDVLERGLAAIRL